MKNKIDLSKVATLALVNELERRKYLPSGAGNKNYLQDIPLKDAIENWLISIRSASRRRNYTYYLRDLILRFPFVFPEKDGLGNIYTVGHFRNENHIEVIDSIKEIDEWSPVTRKNRAYCYSSLVNYFYKISNGWFPRIRSLLLEADSTVDSRYANRVTKSLTFHEWRRFIRALRCISKRDSLMARCMLQGCHIEEIINLKLDQINFEQRTIVFNGGGLYGQKFSEYSADFMDELRDYIESTSIQRKELPFVFISRNGKKLYSSRLNYVFTRAAKAARLKKVTPYMMRLTWDALVNEKGISEEKIMKIPYKKE